jgi:hypothetical protein
MSTCASLGIKTKIVKKLTKTLKFKEEQVCGGAFTKVIAIDSEKQYRKALTYSSKNEKSVESIKGELLIDYFMKFHREVIASY